MWTNDQGNSQIKFHNFQNTYVSDYPLRLDVSSSLNKKLMMSTHF